MGRAIVSLSGGLDSTTVLAHVLDSYQRPDVLAVGFAYGSKHNALENAAAARVAAYYDVPFRLIDLSAVMKDFPSTLMAGGPPVPEGHYEAETMRQTVVPGRNLIFLSVLAGIAEGEHRRAGSAVDRSSVWLGAHQGDHYIYPDCRPEFFQSAARAVYRSSDGRVVVMTPFIMDGKADILRRGLIMRVPYHLTRTCYTSDPVACGKCGACQERLAAFAECGAEDPLPYQSTQIFPKKPVKSD
jgi:7-cyano-7-deazaguanine synthase